jgi:hypothetical protein
VLGAIGKQKFTKALVLSTGASVVEVELVLAGFWPQPIQWAGIAIGAVCSLAALAAFVWAVVYWIVQDDFPGFLLLAGLVLGVLGLQGFILALVGEYLGRIQRDVEGRPLYTVERELGGVAPDRAWGGAAGGT